MKSKQIKIGYIERGRDSLDRQMSNPVFIEIEETQVGFNLAGSIRGHGLGQVCDSIRKSIKENKFEFLIPEKDVMHILDYWDKWNMNDMNAGCTHQNDFMNELRVNQPDLLKDYWKNYGKIANEMKTAHLNPCAICNYEYGSKWRLELPPPKELKWIRKFKAKWENIKLGRRMKQNVRNFEYGNRNKQ